MYFKLGNPPDQQGLWCFITSGSKIYFWLSSHNLKTFARTRLYMHWRTLRWDNADKIPGFLWKIYALREEYLPEQHLKQKVSCILLKYKILYEIMSNLSKWNVFGIKEFIFSNFMLSSWYSTQKVNFMGNRKTFADWILFVSPAIYCCIYAPKEIAFYLCYLNTRIF